MENVHLIMQLVAISFSRSAGFGVHVHVTCLSFVVVPVMANAHHHVNLLSFVVVALNIQVSILSKN